MKTIKWELLKKRASGYFGHKVCTDNLSLVRSIFNVYLMDEVIPGNQTRSFTGMPDIRKGAYLDYLKKIRDLISRWDIRCVRQLLDAMERLKNPILPATQTECIEADYDDNGEWVIRYGKKECDENQDN